MNKKILILLIFFLSSFSFVGQIFAETESVCSSTSATSAASSTTSACGPAHMGTSVYGPSGSSLCVCSDKKAIVTWSPSNNRWEWSCIIGCGPYREKCWAYKATPVNGQCGTSNGGSFSSAPTSGLCNSGTASSITGTGPWYWNCNGINLGSTVSCSANKAPTKIDGQCGLSHGSAFEIAPTTGLCSAGTASYVSGTGPWTWKCAGHNGGTSVNCSAQKISKINGQCGSSNGGYFYSAPTTGLCNSGTASYVSGTGPWTWTCGGINGGTTASCSAKERSLIVNGQCGSSNGGSFSSAPTSGFCNSGTFTGITGTGPWHWSCKGQNGGSTASCSAQLKINSINGQCGSSNGGTFSLLPTSGLCNSGTPSIVASTGSGWTWTCTGLNGGSNAGCYAYKPSFPVNGQCGSSNGGSFSSAPTSGFCNSGTFTGITGTGPWYWSCAGQNGGSTANCLAQLKVNPVNGQCGSSNGGTFSLLPTSGLCNSGTPSIVASTGSGWTWTCTGLNGGSNAGCYAYKESSPVNGQCGSSNGGSFSSAPTTGLCNIGTASSITGSGPWYWSCSGTNGGLTANCSAQKILTPTNGQCGSSNGGSFSSAPTTGLCNIGTASSITGSGPWYWSCSGTNGGLTANCSAQKILTPTNGQCGSSNGGTFETAPTSGLCSSGYTNGVTGSGPWYWVCYGQNGGGNDSCSAIKQATPINGQCGSSNGGSFSSTPTYGLCSSGTVSGLMFTENGWSWICKGSNGGINDSCSATKVVAINGQCGSSNGGSFSNTPTVGLCESGIASAISGSGPWTWSCKGSNGGTTSYCSATKIAAVDGKCGCAHGQTFNIAPLTCLCTTGTPSLVIEGANNAWTWTCKGETSGKDECCTAYKKVTNSKPIVDAGDNLEVAPGASITIEAIASDADKDALTYSWRCNAGALSSWSVLQPVWTAPTTNTASSYTCTITVSDGKDTATDTMSIRIRVDKVNGICGTSHGQTLDTKPISDLCESGTASLVSGTGPWTWTCSGINGGTLSYCSADRNNHVPVIDMIGTRELNESQTILLKAEATDEDNDNLTYYWSCSGGRLSGSSVLKPYFTAPSTATDRTHTCMLTVKDGKGGIASESVSILIRTYSNNKNNVPTIEIGDNKEVRSGQTISLSGAQVSDPDGDSLTYKWYCTGGTLSNKNSLNPTFTAPIVTGNQNYTCTLTVSDGKGGYASDSLSVIAKPGANTKNTVPVVATIQAREVNQGQSITLYAIAYDPDGDNLSYSWSCSGGNLSDSTSLMPIYTAYAYSTSNTNYRCTITANDGRGGSTSASVSITVRGTGGSTSSKVTVDAGSNKELNQGQSITLEATASDSNGDTIFYDWSCTGGTLSNSNSMNPNYTAPYTVGSYTCRVTVRNSFGSTASDSLTITTRAEPLEY
ncbi:PKD domain-containing protein [bacterium]|nr:PKD domain-containing protein [bacterium]